MKNETTIRGFLALSLITLSFVSFLFVQNQREFERYKVSTTKQIYNLSSQVDSLKGEMESQQIVTEHFVYLWEQMEGLYPKDAKKIQHETE